MNEKKKIPITGKEQGAHFSLRIYDTVYHIDTYRILVCNAKNIKRGILVRHI